MLIFDVNEHYKKLLECGFEKFPNKRDLLILSRKWMKNETLTVEELKVRIIDFCAKWNREFNYARSENMILWVISEVGNNPFFAKNNLKIGFSKKEIDTLKDIKDKKEQKIYFIIMCLAKWKNTDYIYLSSNSIIKLSDIFNLAGIKYTKKQQEILIHSLYSQNFINIEVEPLLKCEILGIDNNGPTVFTFTMNDNAIEQLNNLFLDKCERCGKPFTKKSNRQKYCDDCMIIVKREQKLKYWNKTH